MYVLFVILVVVWGLGMMAQARCEGYDVAPNLTRVAVPEVMGDPIWVTLFAHTGERAGCGARNSLQVSATTSRSEPVRMRVTETRRGRYRVAYDVDEGTTSMQVKITTRWKHVQHTVVVYLARGEPNQLANQNYWPAVVMMVLASVTLAATCLRPFVHSSMLHVNTGSGSKVHAVSTTSTTL